MWLDRIEPREVMARMDGDRLWWSKFAELVAWATWQIVLSIPYSGREKGGGNNFVTWLRQNAPPYFIPPKRRA